MRQPAMPPVTRRCGNSMNRGASHMRRMSRIGGAETARAQHNGSCENYQTGEFAQHSIFLLRSRRSTCAGDLHSGILRSARDTASFADLPPERNSSSHATGGVARRSADDHSEMLPGPSGR